MKTILIANRGEIALRIMRTARRLGYRCAAVYSDADAGAPHVRFADCACRIGAGPARDSYLDMQAVLRAAHTLGADAVHPGYGFLAENADFAKAVIDAGLVWIGPPPQAMRAMGNKAGAKRLLAERDVPLLPGYQGTEQDDAILRGEALRIGLPLMIKAAAGGGGRGMRLVQHVEELDAALQRARSEAQQAFGSGELILERALIAPRHVEVQVFADTQGNVVHLGERDCSVQRRHQKLIEETPSPAVDPVLRARLGAAAVEAARACGYVGAGTIEFLLDATGAFWFMEMNTRLQVEHPVTEAITGLDLVEWQLRVAEGESLPLTQPEIDTRLAQGGHSIEVRLCAEDPASDFLPQSGWVQRWRAPQELRVEHALADGLDVPPHYDSMLAKLVAHGATREEARRKLLRGLDECLLLGIPSNQDFLIDCLDHEVFARGEATTDFIDRFFPADARGSRESSMLVRCAAAALLLADDGARQNYPLELAGWSSSLPFEDELVFELDGVPETVAAAPAGTRAWRFRVGTESVCVSCARHEDGRLALRVGEDEEVVHWVRGIEGWFWRFRGRNHRSRDLSAQPAKGASGSGGNGILKAPMNGKVTMLHVASGDTVSAGQPLMVLEAMKMEHSIAAPCAGRVEALHVALGDQVAPGMVLAAVQSEEGKAC